MTYLEWIEDHGAKHKAIVDKLTKVGYTQTEIIDYFDYDNMVYAETYFCLLYHEKTKCHNMNNLNCYMCGCPYFRCSDTGVGISLSADLIKSMCSIHSKNSMNFKGNGEWHLDCSNCTVPHTKKFIQKFYNPNWLEIMKETNDDI